DFRAVPIHRYRIVSDGAQCARIDRYIDAGFRVADVHFASPVEHRKVNRRLSRRSTTPYGNEVLRNVWGNQRSAGVGERGGGRGGDTLRRTFRRPSQTRSDWIGQRLDLTPRQRSAQIRQSPTCSKDHRRIFVNVVHQKDPAAESG